MSRNEMPVTKAQRPPSPSKSSQPKPSRKPDRRVRETRDALGDALVKLMHAKPFEEITVQHILDGAGVSRSTFYSHYSDKNDLFLSDAEEFFHMMASALSEHRDKSRRLAPVREMFEHAAEWRPFLKAMAEAGKIQDVMEIGRECFARGIARRIEEIGAMPRVESSNGREVKVRVTSPDQRTRTDPRASRLAPEVNAQNARNARPLSSPGAATAISQMLAGSLMSLMSWWLAGGQGFSAAQMDDLFHKQAWDGIGKAAG
jgi:AcrR family transcriptional regulator